MQIVWGGCYTTLVWSPAGSSLLRSGEDGLLIPTGWFAVASHDTSDMLTIFGVTEMLARAKGNPTFIIFHIYIYIYYLDIALQYCITKRDKLHTENVAQKAEL